MNTKLTAAALGLALLTGRVAHAAPNSNAVFIGGTPIMRVRVPVAGYTAEQRASAIQERLNHILASGPIHPEDITVSALGNEAVVKVKGQLLFTADHATARFNQATPMQLAAQWADHMKAVLPGLTTAK